MTETALARELTAERSAAIRTLLSQPLIDTRIDPDEYTAVVRHQSWLTEWFESTCGWQLVIDGQASFARLHKRRSEPDPTRPLRRPRGTKAPFDRRRYELLCRICAAIISPPMTTLGLLAQQVVGDTTTSSEGHRSHGRFDTSLRRERAAFVDALLALADLGVVELSGGDVDTYVDDPSGNAIITADVSRIHQLLSSAVPPSQLRTDDVDEAIIELSVEPRYRLAADANPGDVVTDEERNRRLRHSLARRVLDDPVIHIADLAEDERSYLASPSGRQWLRGRVEDAGLSLELRAEGVLAIDETLTASDLRFPGPDGNVWQVALLLIDRFLQHTDEGTKLVERSTRELESTVADLLRAHRSWAKSYRVEGGSARLAAEAVDVLTALGLARPKPDTPGIIEPRPAIARYRAGDIATTTNPTMPEPTTPDSTPGTPVQTELPL